MKAKQRGLIGLILYAIAGVAVVAAIGTVIWKINHWENAAWREEHALRLSESARADALDAAIQKAKDQAAAIAVLYGEQVTATQAAEVRREGERNARFEVVASAARRLPVAVARSVFPAPAARVLDDAIIAGNAAITRPASEPAKEPATVAAAPASTDAVDVAGVVGWGVAVADLYSACVDQVHGWIGFYSGLQQANQ